MKIHLTDKMMADYHCNMATMIELSEWFDYLKENDVYDNTRIILVADHGISSFGVNNSDYSDLKLDEDTNVFSYNPLLMVKDFKSRTGSQGQVSRS